MASMLELIRDGSAPPSLMRRAARGELSLPADEAVEILVTLAADREFGVEAEQTLAVWDEVSLVEVASRLATPLEVLLYLLRSQTTRPAVVTALCNNPALEVEDLEASASHGDVPLLKAMLGSARVRNSSRLLELMSANLAAEPARLILARLQAAAQEGEAEEACVSFLARHADEVAREDGQLFELVAPLEGEDDPLDQLLTRAKNGEPAETPEDQHQLSLLQKIARLRVGERIKLALRGGREERMILIRDRSKLVSLAVLDSPKVNDTEMETYASMKNVQEAVLRAIGSKRKYMKNYGVIRALANNPKAPLDVALPLVSHLLVKDLRALSINKNVNETLRKMGKKLFLDKTERKKD